MYSYAYRAVNRLGHPVQGRVRAANLQEAQRQIEANELVPIEIRSAEETMRRGAARFRRLRVRPRDFILFNRQFAALLNAGVPILQALEVLRSQAASPALRAVASRLQETVSGGARLSEAVAEFPRVFPASFIHMLMAGETSGSLPEVLRRAADWMEREEQTCADIRAAVRYPIAVLIALVLASLTLVTMVIPTFARLFARSRVPLPWPTRMLLAINDVLQAHGSKLLIGLILLIVAIRLLLRISVLRQAWDRRLFHLPVIGAPYTQVVLARFARILALLVRSGVPVIRSLQLAPGVVANTYFRACAQEVLQEVESGASVVEGFQRCALFPRMLVSLVGVGEKTGTLDEMLEHLATEFEAETRYRLRTLTSTLEPVITVIVALGVLFLALAVYLPIWSLSDVLR